MDKSRASDGRWSASRRTLLGLGAAASADLVLAPWRRAWGAEHRQGRALVVGAGMSGLGAARTLADAGWQVTVLEARERIGGRVWTDRSLGLPLDLGGQWIEGATANPMAALARRHGLVTKVDADEWLYFGRDGKPIAAAESDANATEIQKLVGRIVAYGETLDRDVSWRQAVEHVLASDRLSERRRDLVEQFLVGLETTWSGGADALSLWHGDAAESFGGDNLLLPEGYGQIADRLAAGLDVRLGQVVSAIAQHDDGVRVEAGGKTFEADQVIVTVPLGVLKRQAIRFSPALPQAKSSAIERVGFGLLDKVVLVFERAFWPPNYDDFGHLDARPGRYAEILSWQRAGGQPVLFAFAAAAFAREMEELSDTAVVAEAMRVVRKLFGSKAPEPRRSKVVRWGKDPFAYGSYSFLAVGATPADLDTLAEPFGRVAFAGEATNRDHQASVHGAYLSGVREAQRLMAG